MEKHKFFSDDGTMITLPVTPGKYTFGFGKVKKIVNIYGAGEYTLPGRRTASSQNLDVLLPAQKYPFCVAWQPPETILAWLKRQADNNNRVQYVITEANVCEDFYIQSVNYGKQDGTRDIYARIVLQQAPSIEAPTSLVPSVKPSVVQEQKVSDDVGSEEEDKVFVPMELPPPDGDQHVVQSEEENLWTICWDKYGREDLVTRLAAHNGIDPYDPLKVGQTIYLPDLSEYKRGGL